MSYIERERQRADALQQEELDWLHSHHVELVEQTRLLREIARHTGLQYALTVIALVLAGTAGVVALCVAAIAGAPGMRAAFIVVGLTVLVVATSAFRGRRKEWEG